MRAGPKTLTDADWSARQIPAIHIGESEGNTGWSYFRLSEPRSCTCRTHRISVQGQHGRPTASCQLGILCHCCGKQHGATTGPDNDVPYSAPPSSTTSTATTNVSKFRFQFIAWQKLSYESSPKCWRQWGCIRHWRAPRSCTRYCRIQVMHGSVLDIVNVSRYISNWK